MIHIAGLDVLVLWARSQVLCQSWLDLSDFVCAPQGSQPGKNPVAPEGKLGIVRCRRVRVYKQKQVCSVSWSVGLYKMSK